ncbi:MAG: hypothetical protein Q9191_000771 [Dirinaria sp. TL-2023a]
MEEHISEAELFKVESDDEECSASDSKSVVSDSSDDSDMEPFTEYLPKIQKLLSEIGLEGFCVEPLQHGYSCQNCVYALKNLEDEKEQYVLRVPNCPDMEVVEAEERCTLILNDASLLEFLAGNLPVPRVKAYCATTNNALNAPFTVQTKLPGQSLDHVYGELNYSEKIEIVDQFVELLVKLEAVKFATAGTFTPSCPLPNTMHDFFATAAPSIKMFDGGEKEFVKNPKSVQDRTGPDVKALLVSHLNGFIALEQANVEVHGTFRSERLRPLLQMLEDMDREGSFSDGPYPIVLQHWDLEPRNIMVEKCSGTWKFVGIIDWDDALSVPRPLARRAPEWIWDMEPQEFTGYLDNDHDPTLVLSEEDAALKAHFDAKAAAVLPQYLEDAYGRGRWLRRIWTYARNEIGQPYLLDRAEAMRKEWEARQKIESQSEKCETTETRTEQPKGMIAHTGIPKLLWKKSLIWLRNIFGQ